MKPHVKYSVAYKLMNGHFRKRAVQAPDPDRAWMIAIRREFDIGNIAVELLWVRDEETGAMTSPRDNTEPFVLEEV